MRKTLLVLAVLFSLAVSVQAEELELGELMEGTTSDDNLATYSYEAEEAGALTLVARSANGDDIVLVVTDAAGMPLEDARIDTDYAGNTGAEQGVVIIPHEGEFKVVVMPYSSEADFELVATWLPWDAVAVPRDEDGSPLGAIALDLDDWYSDDIGFDEADRADWYEFEAEEDGTLTVETRGDSGDVVLELYEEGEYFEPLDTSDQDLDGENTNELLTLSVDDGEVYFFRVRSYGSATEYELRASLEGSGGGRDNSRPRGDK